MRYIHSFIFSKSFILMRVAVDPEPIPGTLGARQENVLVGREFFPWLRSPTRSRLGNNSAEPVQLPACFWEVKKPENQEETHMNTGELSFNMVTEILIIHT